MRRIVAAAMLATVATPALAQADWRMISINSTEKTYVDFNAVEEISGGARRAWVKSVYVRHQPDGSAYTVSIFYFNCREQSIATKSRDHFAEDGSVISADESPDYVLRYFFSPQHRRSNLSGEPRGGEV